ncbi:MAG: hypothetical protein ACO3SE_09190, partial [Sedimenticolaceae bacterium]
QEVVSRNDRRKDLLKRMDGVVEETVKEMLPINQILKTYLNKNAVDVMNGEPMEPEPEPEMAPDSDMFPGDGELPVEDEPEMPEEPMESAESSEPSFPMPEEPMDAPQEETKSFTFNDKIAKRAPMPPMEEEEDFSINPSANR